MNAPVRSFALTTDKIESIIYSLIGKLPTEWIDLDGEHIDLSDEIAGIERALDDYLAAHEDAEEAEGYEGTAFRDEVVSDYLASVL